MGILGEGVMGRVARGVPECFVTGKVVRKEKKEVKKEDGVGPMATVGAPAPIAAGAPAATMVAPASASVKDTVAKAP